MSPKNNNAIEQQFYDAYIRAEGLDNPANTAQPILVPKVQIGPYVVDFLFDDRYVIEIDGHEYHKTKEQRYADYTRERYLMKNGYIVIRFMATEVFIDASKCALEMLKIATVLHEQIVSAWEAGRAARRIICGDNDA